MLDGEEAPALGAATQLGADIFKGLPNYPTFNKPFVDPSDVLFLKLNEINPANWEKNDGLFSSQVPNDSTPADEDEQPNSTIRFKRTEGFYYHKRSNMNESIHMARIRILQHCGDADDAAIWKNAKATREREAKEFQNVVKEYELMEGCSLYLPTLDLIGLYKKYYKSEVERLLQLEEDLAFNTRVGLPLVSSGNFAQTEVELAGVEWVARRGLVPMWSDVQQVSWRDVKANLTEHSEHCTQVDSLEQQLCNEFRHILELPEYADENQKFYIPLDTLVFLLAPGESHDLSTEVLLVIKEREVHGDKLIYFEKPLPARYCGWHTNKTALEKACMAHLSLREDIRWLRLTDGEIDTAGKIESELKHNTSCIKWELRDTDGTSSELNIYTTLTLPPTCDDKATCFLANYCFKLEYKPHFGAERFTKHELLKMWLQTTFMTGHTNSIDGICVRVSVKDFEPIAEQTITANQIAQQLHDHYNIEIHRLITGLSGFLKLLSANPSGKYLLRYTPKYCEQLLLCAATTQDIRESTVHLHELLKTQASSGLFMRTPHHFPICNDVCTRMHTEYKVMPCAFRPHQPGARISKCAPFQFLNDRDAIIKASKEKKEAYARPGKCEKNAKRGSGGPERAMSSRGRPLKARKIYENGPFDCKKWQKKKGRKQQPK